MHWSQVMENVPCPISFSKNHTAEKCFKLNDWCRSNEYITKNPRVQEKMVNIRPTARTNKRQDHQPGANQDRGPPKHILHEIRDSEEEDDSTEEKGDKNEGVMSQDESSDGEQDGDTGSQDIERGTLRCINIPDDDEHNEVNFDYTCSMEGTIQEEVSELGISSYLVDEIHTPRAHIDDGSALNAVCDKRLLFKFTEYSEPQLIGQDAQGNKILAYGDGYARYVAKGPSEGYHDTQSYYAPGLTTNFFSVNRLEVDVNGPRIPGDKNRRMSYVRKDWSAKCGYAFVKHKNVNTRNLEIPGILIKGHVYAELIVPTNEEHVRGAYPHGVIHF